MSVVTLSYPKIGPLEGLESNRIYALLILGENRLILLWFCASQWIIVSTVIFPFCLFSFSFFPGFFLRKLKENLYEIVYVLRPVYTGDFCCYFSGDFCCDFTSKLLLAIQIAAESPVVYTAKSHLKSQQKLPLKLQQNPQFKRAIIYSIQTALDKVQTSCLRLPARAPFPKR